MINNRISDSSNQTQFLLPKVPNMSKRSTVSSFKSNGSSDSGADTSDSSDDKTVYDILKCACCPYITNELSFYIYHLKSVHGTDTLQCINCCSNLSIDSFQRHISKCKGSYACEFCTATFAQKSYLQRHVSRIHLKNTIKYVCDICGQNLSTNNNLKQHKLIHSDASQFVCEFCNKGFVQKIHYNTHLDSKHSKCELLNLKKPYNCCLCKEQFIFHTSLQQHVNTCCFKKEKRFSCSICDKSFIYPSELKRHEHIHLNKFYRLYSCNYCDKTYNRLYQFIEHQFFHENVSAFKCPICGKVLSQLAYLKKHYQRHFNKTNTCNINSNAITNNDKSLLDNDVIICGVDEGINGRDSLMTQVDEVMDNNMMTEENCNMDDFCVSETQNNMTDDNSQLIDRFIEEIWDRFYPFLDENKISSISYDDLKLDIWEEFYNE